MKVQECMRGDESVQCPLVSIVIPAYNAAAYIYDSVASVVNQDYENIEVIIVNDGSIDATEEIVLSIPDKRIKFITQENMGVAMARNTGISNVSGEWVMFLDADDRLAEGIIADVVNAMEPDTDCMLFHFYKCIGNSVQLKRSFPAGAALKKPLDHFFDLSYAYGTLWAKVFHRSLLMENDFRFDVSLSVGEDRDAMYELLLKSKRVQFFENEGKGGYFYRVNGKSISHICSDKMVESYVYLCEKMTGRYNGVTEKVALQEYCAWNCGIQIRLVINGIFNPGNLKSYKEKRKYAETLLSRNLFKDAFEIGGAVIFTHFGIKKRFVAFAIKKEWYLVLNLIGKIRYRQIL